MTSDYSAWLGHVSFCGANWLLNAKKPPWYDLLQENSTGNLPLFPASSTHWGNYKRESIQQVGSNHGGILVTRKNFSHDWIHKADECTYYWYGNQTATLSCSRNGRLVLSSYQYFYFYQGLWMTFEWKCFVHLLLKSRLANDFYYLNSSIEMYFFGQRLFMFLYTAVNSLWSSS